MEEKKAQPANQVNFFLRLRREGGTEYDLKDFGGGQMGNEKKGRYSSRH